ncbi:tyrosine-type recombinase/integrase [Alicyclobacillus acidoterrestris]|uniref:tyrosine-type recombinase/integrase n=1 Tax=Alicyclobacillus acidoterrestris TaxID=1450 RepID=UPI003898FC94
MSYVGHEFGFHDLRHTHATWLLGSNVDLKTVRQTLGQKREQTRTCRSFLDGIRKPLDKSRGFLCSYGPTRTRT